MTDDTDSPNRIPFKQCPECGCPDHLEVQATLWLRLTKTGEDSRALTQNPYHQYNLRSPAACGHCGYRGALRDFHLDPQPTATPRQ
jgi:hypothetical protein